jgi:hypothetical protein
MPLYFFVIFGMEVSLVVLFEKIIENQILRWPIFSVGGKKLVFLARIQRIVKVSYSSEDSHAL